MDPCSFLNLMWTARPLCDLLLCCFCLPTLFMFCHRLDFCNGANLSTMGPMCYLTPPYLIWYYLIVSYFILSHLILFNFLYLISFCLLLSTLIWSYAILIQSKTNQIHRFREIHRFKLSVDSLQHEKTVTKKSMQHGCRVQIFSTQRISDRIVSADAGVDIHAPPPPPWLVGIHGHIPFCCFWFCLGGKLQNLLPTSR